MLLFVVHWVEETARGGLTSTKKVETLQWCNLIMSLNLPLEGIIELHYKKFTLLLWRGILQESGKNFISCPGRSRKTAAFFVLTKLDKESLMVGKLLKSHLESV